MLSKKEFVRAIEILKAMDEKEHSIYKASNGAINFSEIDEYSELFTNYVRLLELSMGIEPNKEIYGSDISYFIYEINYGKDWTPDSVTEDGVSIDISTAEKLYDFLSKEK